jgi:hypothetical protein
LSDGEPITLDASPTPVPVHILNCSNVRFDFSQTRLAQLTIERCTNIRVKIGTVIGAVEVIRCSDSGLSVDGEKAGTVTLDNCMNCKIDLRVEVENLTVEGLPDALRRCNAVSVFSSGCTGVSLGLVASSEASNPTIPRYDIPDDAKEGNRAWRHRTRVVEEEGQVRIKTQLVNLYGDVVEASEGFGSDL